jgi:diguanylate cyclase (GGDEF)-like protein
VELAYATTRRILRANDADEARQAVADLCRSLGATIVPADRIDPDALPVDVSLDGEEPLVPASADGEVRLAVQRFVIPAVADARIVLERTLSSERLRERATRDPLTGLWNRRSLSLAIDRARPGDTIALIDLDHFKHVNDTLGHVAGDEVLVCFGEHLRGGVRDHDVVGRLGGEEFVVLLPRTGSDVACAVLDRLRLTWPAASPQNITFSAGVAHVQSDEPGAARAALELADARMYEAKAAGRNRIVGEEQDP